MYEKDSVVILSACRTAIGSLSGSFKATPAHDLGAACIKECLKRANLSADLLSEVIMGQSLTAGQGQNCARQASLKAGVPKEVPAYGINMLCGSGLKTVYLGYQAIKSKEASFIVAGGQESMSMGNHCILLRQGVKLGAGTIQDTVIVDGLTDPTIKMHMGDTAEALAQKYNVSREAQDRFALQSQHKACDAIKNGYFEKEIVPLTVREGRKEVVVKTDEFPRQNTTYEGLSALRPVFQGGSERTVTAGNASGVNDGAAAVLLTTYEECEKKGIQPMAKIVGFAQTGLEPVEMGLGPIDAVNKLLKKIDWKLEDVDLFELNEAFAVQSLLVIEKLKVDPAKVNIAGGAIALGHPIGCSGARVLVTLLHNMERCNKKKGIAALCIGGGMGIAIAVERNT